MIWLVTLYLCIGAFILGGVTGIAAAKGDKRKPWSWWVTALIVALLWPIVFVAPGKGEKA